MTFFSLYETKKTHTIKNKKRISIIVPYKSSQLIIFYKDCSYEHIDIHNNNKVLHEGKLDVVVTKWINVNSEAFDKQSNKSEAGCGFLFLNGQRNVGGVLAKYIGVLNIKEEVFKPYESLFFQVDNGASYNDVNYHVLWNKVGDFPKIVEITQNVQNGIMIRCFDFRCRAWLEECLYLGSKYLNHIFVAVPHQINQFFQSQSKSESFCIIANGQKSESVHIACISILIKSKKSGSHIHSSPSSISGGNQFQSQGSSIMFEEQKQLTLQHHITRQLKYYKNFTIIGANITRDGYLFFIGNSLYFETKQQRSQAWQPVSAHLNFKQFMTNTQTIINFNRLQNFKIGRQIIVRDYIGQIQGDLIFIVQNDIKKSFHKLCPQTIISKQKQFDQQIHTIQQQGKYRTYQISLDKRGIFSYDLICQQFFQKIKDSPSIIKISNLIVVSKNMYYHRIIQRLLPQGKNEDNLIMNILSLL